MFIYYNSGSLSELIKPLSDALSVHRKNHPFKKTWIIVQNKEAQQWLSLQLANISGISFNIEYILPSELLWKLYRKFDPELPAIMPSDRVPMQWKIFDLLEGYDRLNDLQLSDNSTQTNFQLAGQIADVFDLYQQYRPKMLDAWERGALLKKDESELWQSKLWNQLNDMWKAEHEGVPTRSKLYFDLKRILDRNTSLEIGVDAIFTFGLSSFSGSFIDVLESLSTQVDVHFFRNDYAQSNTDNVSERLKDELAVVTSEGNDLIRNIKEGAREGDFKEVSFETSSTSVFSRLSTAKEEVIPISINSCHSIRREVEVLKDQILSHLDSDTKLNPEDILVLVPDIEKYGAMIEAVFSEGSNVQSIHVYNPASGVNKALLDFTYFLELLHTEFNSTDVIELLSRITFQERFGFQEEDVFIIKGWMVSNNIHRGLSIDDSHYSMEKASINFLSGFMLEGDEFQYFDDHVPYSVIDSTNDASLAAKFSSLIRFLKRWRSLIDSPKSFTEWTELLQELTRSLYSENKELESEWSSLQHFINTLNEQAIISNSTRRIDFGLFKSWLKNQLNSQSASSTRFGRGILISSYIPYRGIPFKYLYLLGMNEKEFPRNSLRPSFDLIENYPEPGDRINKKDDSFLFFELLNNTLEYLHISYLGQDLYSKDEKLPSVLIQKLTDFYPSIFLKKHKLHGFDRAYFESSASYSGSYKQLAEEIYSNDKNTSFFIHDYNFETELSFPIKLDDIVQFFSHPARYILTRLFQIRTPFEQQEVEDREVFKISGLSKYKIDHFLFQALTDGHSGSDLENFVKVSGMVPNGIPGSNDFRREIETISELFEFCQAYRSEEKMELGFHDHFPKSGAKLEGKISDIYSTTRLIIKPSRVKARDLISAWIYHLAMQTLSANYRTVILARNQYNTGNIEHSFSEVKQAKALLDRLVVYFQDAYSSPNHLAFFPESSRGYTDALLKGKKKPLLEGRKTWEGSTYLAGDGSDYYNSLVWRDHDPINTPSFTKNSELVWKPLLEHLEKESKG
ncbi:MAG: hypothetical protein ED557_00775 [Balneola sp.]|nr:MAG: hypothetical protein ED557_00775 [Balneola sp.]